MKIDGVTIGDMAKSTYDPDKDGLIALAQLVAAVCSETEAQGKVDTHAGIAAAHHAVHLKTLADHVLGTVVPHDALASLTEKAHSSLTGVTANQHHTPPSIAFGSYTGNGSDDRRVTTGFVCKLVILQAQRNTEVATFIILNITGKDCIEITDTAIVDDQAKPYLHATDGFTLGNSQHTGNLNGTLYKYAAFG